MDVSSPTVLLVYQRLSLPWIFESAEKNGIQIILVPRPDEEADLGRLPPAVVNVLRIDIEADPVAALQILRARQLVDPFDGAVTLYDPLVPFIAELTEALGLNGTSAPVARALHDKRMMRQVLSTAGLNAPRFVGLTGPEDWKLGETLTFPVVVKPAEGFSSMGVTKVGRIAELQVAVAEVGEICREKLRGSTGLVIEEFLDGPEYAVESLVDNGIVHILSIGEKGEPTGPHFEEGIYRAPAVLAPVVALAIKDEVIRAHEALGISTGPTHTELRLHGRSTPVILEIGARIGGSGVSHFIVQQSTGVDFAGEALRVAVGLPCRIKAAIENSEVSRVVAANYIVPTGGFGRIVSISGLDEVEADPRVVHCIQMLKVGDVVYPYPNFTGYPAFILSRHPDGDDAEFFHEQLAAQILIEYALTNAGAVS